MEGLFSYNRCGKREKMWGVEGRVLKDKAGDDREMIGRVRTR